MKRRRFIQLGSVSMVAARAFSQDGNPVPLRVRKSALQLPGNDPVFAKYAEAVKKMHELPADDKRHWRNQGKIHADRCPHGTTGFLPWHRHYILYFEKICGELIGDPQFALPYWDWTDKNGIIPDAFFDIPELTVEHWNDPGKYDSPFPEGWTGIDTVAIRAIGKNTGVQSDPFSGGAFTATTINSILSENAFDLFGGRLEGSPHNSGHVVVGFPDSGKIGHIGSGLSSLDPLFWLHHCNVDRLWAQWQLAGNETPVFNLDYNGHFVDPSQAAVNVTADGSKDFISLGYTYDSIGDPNALAKLANLIPADAPAKASPLSIMKAPKLVHAPRSLGVGKIEGAVAIGREKKVTVSASGLKEELGKVRPVLDSTLPPLEMLKSNKLTKPMLANFGKQAQRPRRIMARIKGLQASGFERDPVVNVFVNCPYLTPGTPYKDPHYAGTFALFGASRAAGAGGHDHHKGQDFYIDLTSAVRELDQEKLDKIDVQFMAIAGDPNAPGKGTFTFESLEILSL